MTIFLKNLDLSKLKQNRPKKAANHPNRPSFPLKLHRMLAQVEREGKGHIVSWNADGRTFQVHDHEKFVSEVLHRHFKQTKYKSFQRQLNFYSYRRITSGPLEGAYGHPSFIKENEEACQKVKSQESQEQQQEEDQHQKQSPHKQEQHLQLQQQKDQQQMQQRYQQLHLQLQIQQQQRRYFNNVSNDYLMTPTNEIFSTLTDKSSDQGKVVDNNRSIQPVSCFDSTEWLGDDETTMRSTTSDFLKAQRLSERLSLVGMKQFY
jgi:hypothetical protein